MKIAVAGIGYVGLANALMLAQDHEVVALDVLDEKIELLNKKISPVIDDLASEFLQKENLNFVAVIDKIKALKDAAYVIVATPTNYDPVANYFDTSSVEAVIRDVLFINPQAIIIIKSTVPVGYTKKIRKDLGVKNIIFSPVYAKAKRYMTVSTHPESLWVSDRKGQKNLRNY